MQENKLAVVGNSSRSEHLPDVLPHIPSVPAKMPVKSPIRERAEPALLPYLAAGLNEVGEIPLNFRKTSFDEPASPKR